MSNKHPDPQYQFGNVPQPSPESKRKPKRRTLIKQKLGIENIEDLKKDVLQVWGELIKSANTKEKVIAAKEMSKYIFPQKRELSGELNGQIKVEIVYNNDDKKKTESIG